MSYTTLSINDQKVDGAREIDSWIGSKLDKTSIDYADAFGELLAKDTPEKNEKKKKPLATNQIRNVFGEVRRIQMRIENWNEVEPSVLLLKPKLAYAAKRADRKTADALKDVLTNGITAVLEGETEEQKQQRFQRFVDFFEAILAYHKAHGGD